MSSYDSGALLTAGECSGTNREGISPSLFSRFQRLIYKDSGIWLASHKTALLCGRLSRRLPQVGCQNMADYYSLVAEPENAEERQQMLNCIATNETHFFREPQHFEFLQRSVFPVWLQQAEAGKRPKRARIWSAGCSTGQEPYTLAMLLLRSFQPADSWHFEIIATDISTKALDCARSAMYPIAQSNELPSEYLREYMLRGTGEKHGWIKPAPEVRTLVEFRRLNLMDGRPPSPQPFDLIFCRNVMIYFDRDSKTRAVKLMANSLAKDGLMFVGHSENLTGLLQGLQTLVPTVYLYKKESA